jgi:putative colanic acid biosynthesis UDP-glucose lipid carrier transferase
VEKDYQSEKDDLEILGDIGQLQEIIEKFQVSTVYIVTPLQSSTLLEDVYFILLDQHISVHWIPDIFSLRLVNHSVNEIAGIPVLTLSETPLTGTRLIAKSLEDRMLSCIILLLVSPLLLLIAVAIKLDSPGPVFFRQQRSGWSGKSFTIWKFRSMREHATKEGVIKQAAKCDPRITRLGAFLRRTSLDELPQLVNVLIGDMSLVGPRPHAVQHDEEYSRRITDYFARHHLKPGMTGLAQVRGYRGETRDMNQMVQRVESDIEYINNWSLWLDFTILVRTVFAFTGKHAH